ncbi:MAG TPA: phage tail tape measure protein [Caulobacteraceae bacterium]
MSEFDGGLSAIPQRAAEASAALAAIQAPAEKAAAAIDAAFEKAGASLVRSLGRAAADGKVTMAELAQAVLSAVNAAAGARGGGGLGEAIASVLSNAFSGARAAGGPVNPGGAYLVGERGPEVFRPASAGTVEPASGGMTVNVTVQGGGEAALIRSDAQIAQALARAVSLGARRI